MTSFSFKRKDQAVTLASKGSLKVDGESIQVDTQLLFQRLVLAAKTNLENALEYELCTVPKALFEAPELLHEAQKSTLADAIWTMTGKKDGNVGKDVLYVLDGGALLHRLPWIRGRSFASILQSYSDYVVSHYGQATVVFDGYEGNSTKDMTHARRKNGRKGVSISFSASMNLTITKEAFLSDTSNKQRFVTLLGEQLEGSGCQVFHGKGDADVLIVLKALELANTKDTVLIGDDTDLLVLLLSKDMPQSSKKIFFAPEPKRIHSKTPNLGHKASQS